MRLIKKPCGLNINKLQWNISHNKLKIWKKNFLSIKYTKYELGGTNQVYHRYLHVDEYKLLQLLLFKNEITRKFNFFLPEYSVDTCGWQTLSFISVGKLENWCR